jgi:hypothetical protein
VLGKSRLDGKEEEIRLLLQKQVSKASIAKIVGVTRPTIHRFIKTSGYAHILKGYFYTNLVGTPTIPKRTIPWPWWILHSSKRKPFDNSLG